MLNQEEKFKLAVHLGLFGFGVACALYNLGAYYCDKDCQHRNNAFIYGALVAFEVRAVLDHVREIK